MFVVLCYILNIEATPVRWFAERKYAHCKNRNRF